MAIAPVSIASAAGQSTARRPQYADLKRRVRNAGLFAPRHTYYAVKITLSLALYAGAIALAVILDGWWTLIAAAAVGVMFTQVGLLGHDLQHRQIVRGRRAVTATGIILGNLLIGVSYSWWATKHNAHHGSPNEEGADPDIEFPMLAFSAVQVDERRHSRWRPVVAWQAYLFLPLASLQALNMHIHSFRHVISELPAHWLWEGLGLILHAAGYAALLVYLGWPVAVAFFAVQMAVSGIYNAMVFAPNHKGMPVLDGTHDLDFLHQQVLTSRSVRGHPVTDLVYGGLNYQVEHHLFPTMPRCNLRRAQPIVRAFCQEHGIPYVEDTPAGAVRAIVSHLHEVSAPLRSSRPA